MFTAAEERKNRNFAVLGLGRFGMSVVQSLSGYDVDILACDLSEARTREAAKYATHVVQADVSDETALKTFGLGNFDVVVLAMAEEFEASQTAAMVAREEGAKYIVAKVRSERQKKILEKLGVDKVVLPEREMGVKIARKLVEPNIMEILDESELYTLLEMKPMEKWLGKTIQESDIRNKHDITILAVRRDAKLIIPVPPEWSVMPDDILITISESKKNHSSN